MNVIKVENLGKRYLIGHDKKANGAFRYNSMRDSLAHSIRGIYQKIRHPLSPNRENITLEEFWALKGVNFEIKQGERVGIIGQNGAGKTTILKLLSRITQPTTGSIKIKGRIASLLEVGTGFHPELSGRENIYLNGAILGMKRVEIKSKFDEIVAFAEVEKFLDTPVKRYSSGMYVRLAFAVAAHLEPEILIVDEVLAVGDAAFQKKSLRKMEDVSREGRTVVFVSHNMGAISELTKRVIYLKKGEIVADGAPGETIGKYMLELNKNEESFSSAMLLGFPVNLKSIDVFDSNICLRKFNAPLKFMIKFDSEKGIELDTRLNIRNSLGHRLITTRNFLQLEKGTNSFIITLNDHFLPIGSYILSFGIKKNNKWLYSNPECLRFNISDVRIKDSLVLEKQDKLGMYFSAIVERD